MYMYILTILNVVSSKTLKPGATASPDLPDPRQAAVSVRPPVGVLLKELQLVSLCVVVYMCDSHR